ncbi:Uncharacterised protein [Gordonia bronchialis]|nr:Uncharacterised protein [Gordonia bronchialis]STS10894.1 Uncharacterised protein [Gordonia bronchialis]
MTPVVSTNDARNLWQHNNDSRRNLETIAENGGLR